MYHHQQKYYTFLPLKLLERVGGRFHKKKKCDYITISTLKVNIVFFSLIVHNEYLKLQINKLNLRIY